MPNHKTPLFKFLDQGKTPWHVVELIEKRLIAEGFQLLDLEKAFKLELKKGYFVKKEGTLIAFKLPHKKPETVLFAAAHTDSPTLKLKPKPVFSKNGQLFLAVEVYGAPIYSSFLNRDLAIAGIVYYENKNTVESELIDLQDMPVIIPELAIHLNRDVNEKGTLVNPENHLVPLIGYGEFDLLKTIEKSCKTPKILGHDLFLYPLEKAATIGFDHDLFAAARIDNLGGTFCLLEGFKESQSKNALQMAIFWNHEEIGSETCVGAASPLFLEMLERISQSLTLEDDWPQRMRHGSFGLSVDQAHATHGCYPDKHDLKHEVKLGSGFVIKSNAKKRYATNGYSAASLKSLCNKNKISFQEFSNRNDIPCGSTIGPVLSTGSGFDLIDIGCPQLSMHSAREIASLKDHESMIRLIKAYYQR